MNQKRSIEKNNLLTTLELQRIEETVNDTHNEMAHIETEATEEENQMQSDDVIQVTCVGTASIIDSEREDTNGVELLKELIMKKMKMIKEQTLRDRDRIQRVTNTKETEQLINKSNLAISTINVRNITELNELIYAAAKVIEDKLTKNDGNQRITTPRWKQRLMHNIENTRRDVNILVASKRENKTVPFRLQRRYHLHLYDLSHAIEVSKQRLTALSHRLRRYEARNEQFRINRLFQRNPHKVFEELENKKSNSGQTPPAREEVKEYWEEIWSNSVRHNENAKWIKELENDHDSLPTQRDVCITESDIKHKLEGMGYWKAPGLDKVQIFWLKKLTSLHRKMAEAMNNMLSHPTLMPKWLVSGRTVLIQKNHAPNPTPSDYRPITCLPTIWKVFSGILVKKIMDHVNRNNILYQEQKGARPGARGTKDELAIDRTITKDSKKRHTNLSMAWIDYKKAFDSVPHSWIQKCLKLYNINEKIRTVICHSMKLWKTTLTCDNKDVCDIHIKRGIFQGDALSPLLFCLAINPLSHILRKEGKEYTFKNGGKINHLLYMDDLKLYSKKEEGINCLIRTVKIFSDDIRMKFGYEKCARLIINRGQIKQTSGLEIDDHVIPDVSQSGYKYLGIPQMQGNMDEEAENKARQEYKARSRKILKSKLKAKNKIEAINMYAIPVIQFTCGVIKWTKQEMEQLNKQTRNLLAMYGALHPRADVDRLYLPRRMGGRGLKDIAETIEREERTLADYIHTTETDPLSEIVKSSGLY